MKPMIFRVSVTLLASAMAVAPAFCANGRPAAGPVSETIILTPQGGTAPEDLEISRWQERARQATAKADVFERLGWAYVAKARRTLDAGYYKLAEKTAEAMDARFGASAESGLLRGHVLHNLHRFAEAETVARALVNERGLPNDFALLSDALMEQGKLAEAVEALQRMVNLKPGIESYSRIAHVRWLKGDLNGAIEMMEAALQAGSPRDAESQAWALSRLALFYLQQGAAPRSLAVAESAIKQMAAYPPALLAKGRALAALGKNEDAVGVLERAAELNPLPEYQWWLADVLRAAGHPEKAVQVEAELRGRGEASDPRTLAIFLATRKEDSPSALRLARGELGDRADVFSHDALAWALAASGDWEAADVAMRLALAEHTKEARLFLHAGEIARALGRPDDARKYFAAAEAIGGTLTPSERSLLAGRRSTAALVGHP